MFVIVFFWESWLQVLDVCTHYLSLKLFGLYKHGVGMWNCIVILMVMYITHSRTKFVLKCTCNNVITVYILYNIILKIIYIAHNNNIMG